MRDSHGTLSDMRSPAWISFSLVLLAGFPQFATAAGSCSPAPRTAGTPIGAPHAVFEAYVVDVSTPHSSSPDFSLQGSRRALVEVVRSYHGPYGPGQHVETLTLESKYHCVGAFESGAHVLVASESGGPFEIVATFSRGGPAPEGPFAALAQATEEPRRGLRAALKNASLRGEVDADLAADLYSRARPEPRAPCEISSAGNFAQVSWGRAFGGNDARNKVIFERAESGWVEILRYQAPEPTPARNRARKAKQRALWAFSSRPAAASADSKS
jgi:hypothetical protein